MWFTVFKLFLGPLSQISKDLKEAHQAKLNAQNDRERIAAEERISLLETRKNIILSAQDSPSERWVRILLAFPFIIYLWKLLVWDKVLGLGVTDNLSSDLWQVFLIVLGGYFIDTVVKRIKR